MLSHSNTRENLHPPHNPYFYIFSPVNFSLINHLLLYGVTACYLTWSARVAEVTDVLIAAQCRADDTDLFPGLLTFMSAFLVPQINCVYARVKPHPLPEFR